jgi:hypothetical protein
MKQKQMRPCSARPEAYPVSGKQDVLRMHYLISFIHFDNPKHSKPTTKGGKKILPRRRQGRKGNLDSGKIETGENLSGEMGRI